MGRRAGKCIDWAALWKAGRPQMLCGFETENLYVLQDLSCLLVEYIYIIKEIRNQENDAVSYWEFVLLMLGGMGISGE